MVPRGGWLAQALARVLLGRDEIRPSGAQEPCHPSNLPCCSTPEATVIVGRALYATGGCSRATSRAQTCSAQRTTAASTSPYALTRLLMTLVSRLLTPSIALFTGVARLHTTVRWLPADLPTRARHLRTARARAARLLSPHRRKRDRDTYLHSAQRRRPAVDNIFTWERTCALPRYLRGTSGVRGIV